MNRNYLFAGTLSTIANISPHVIQRHFWAWEHRSIGANIGIDCGLLFCKILGFWCCHSKMVITNLRTWMWFTIFLSVVFLFETKSYSYAITQEITVPIMFALCRLCYCFKNVFSSIRYCIGKTMHMKTVYGAVRGGEWRRKMKKMGMVKNQGMCTFSILRRVVHLENSPDRNYFAAEVRNHAYYTVEFNKLAEVSINTRLHHSSHILSLLF
jgi:hypothetical protein